jgi:hypothetical protein
MFTSLPFQVTPDAEKYIREELRPQPGKEAALVQTGALEARDRRGRVIMRFPGEFFTVGYYEPGQRPHAQHIEMFGVPISVIPETLERLRGRTLTLKKQIYRYGWLRRHTMHFLVLA